MIISKKAQIQQIKLNLQVYHSIHKKFIVLHNTTSMFSKKLLQLSFCAIFFGSIYTIFRKYQSCAQLSDPDKNFNQPLIQSFLIFIGMSTIGLFRPWLKNPKESEMEFAKSADKYPKNGSIFVFLLPSLLDLAGTVVDTAGLFYTSVSVSQMLKGSVIFFTYIITIFHLKKKLSQKKHIFMLVILASLFVIGCSNIQNKDDRYESQPLLGNILIIISQLLFSFMFIVEEKLLKNHQVDVIDAVTWEGIWGSLFAGGLLIVFSNAGSQVVKCDFIESCSLIYQNPNLLIAILCTFMAIGPFNYFGMSITKEASALHRCLMCTFRMVAVWIVSLLAGWESFSFTELLGYIILTYAIYQFNNSDNDLNEKLVKEIKLVNEKEMDFTEIQRLTQGEIEV